MRLQEENTRNNLFFRKNWIVNIKEQHLIYKIVAMHLFMVSMATGVKTGHKNHGNRKM